MNEFKQIKRSKQREILSDILKQRIQWVVDYKKQLANAPSSKGRQELAKYMVGDILNKGNAIIAKCCACSGHYVDGRDDCDTPTCPLYPYMPYGKMRTKYIRLGK